MQPHLASTLIVLMHLFTRCFMDSEELLLLVHSQLKSIHTVMKLLLSALALSFLSMLIKPANETLDICAPHLDPLSMPILYNGMCGFADVYCLKCGG